MSKMKKSNYDSRSVGRRNIGTTISASVGRKEKRDTSNMRKETIQAKKDEHERQVLNQAALDVRNMYTRLLQIWQEHRIPD